MVQAIRRLSLIAGVFTALAGPLVVQSEAAESLSRSLAELVARGVIEPADEQGGDTAGTPLLKIEAHAGLSQPRGALAPLDMPVSLLLLRPQVHSAAYQSEHTWVRSPLPAAARTRQPLLQVFRF